MVKLSISAVTLLERDDKLSNKRQLGMTMRQQLQHLSKRTIQTFSIGVLLTLATPLVMADAKTDRSATEISERTAKVNKKHGVKCRRVRETGSRTSKRVCTTAAQREAQSNRTQDTMDEYRRMSETVPNAGGNS